jgi:transposase
MTIYCGVDFHARTQTVFYCNTEDGEVHNEVLVHQDGNVRDFYAQIKGDVIVGLEASGYSPWFEQMLEEIGHQVWIGDAAQIRARAKRRRQKTDKKDASLILDLMLKDEFPRIYRPPAQSQEILAMLRYRHRLVKIRTMAKNNLQAIAIKGRLTMKSKLLTAKGIQKLMALPVSPVVNIERKQWLSLISELQRRIKETENWLCKEAETDEKAALLRTHPGIGLLTSLILVHTLGPVERFPNRRKLAAYLGMDPTEQSSGDKKRMGGISKAGSRLTRFLLVEAARSAVAGDPALKRFYARLSHRRGKPKAIVAVARKLVIRSYIMLRDDIDYAEFLRRGHRSTACPGTP